MDDTQIKYIPGPFISKDNDSPMSTAVDKTWPPFLILISIPGLFEGVNSLWI